MPRNSRVARALTGALLLTLACVSGANAQDRDRFHWTGSLSPGQTLEIKGVNGEIRALPADGDEIEVLASKHARRSDPASVHIEVVRGDHGVTICAVYPTPRDARQENRCAPGDEGHMSVHRNDVAVDFTVHVPAGIGLVERSVNGDVSAEDLRGDVVAKTVNGKVRVATSGHAEASTVNGGIDVRMGRGDWDDEARFTTVNGSITVAFPPSLGAEVEASTVNGGIDSDFPLAVHGRLNARHINAVIGDGGGKLKLSTVNGSIRLVKSES